MTNTRERISLVIVTWNGDDLLRCCLDSLLKVYGQLPETVIADNANQPSTRQLVESYENTRYIPLPDNLGFAGGNNAALPFCSKDYIILLNNDTEFTADSISPLIAFLDEHPDCAAAQGKIILSANGKLDGCGGFFSPIGILSFEGNGADDSTEFNTPKRVFTIGGAFFALRKSAIAACGGLFYDHFKSYYEEVNLCHRLTLAGFQCWYVPTPPVLHRHSVTMAKFKWFDIQRQYYRNIWFSTLTCFGLACRLRFGFCIAFLSFGQTLVSLLKGNAGYLKTHARVISRIFAERAEIRKERKRLKTFRKLSDRQVLSIAVKSQPWKYYINLIKR